MKHRPSHLWKALLPLALATACADDTADGPPPSLVDRGFGEAADPGPDRTRFLAVVGGDYKTSALSLFDLAPLGVGDVHTAPPRASRVLHSGSYLSGSAAALSGDVVLAQAALQQRRVVLIDRGTAVLTIYDPAQRRIESQVSVATGFYANPQDLAVHNDGNWLVTRMSRNPTPTPTLLDHDEGDDVVVVDSKQGVITQRIALTPWADPQVPDVVAAPQRMAIAADHVWLPLGSFSADFKSQGIARLVAIHRQTLQVAAAWPLPPWRNCVGMQAISDDRLLVSCQGSFVGAQQVAQSALLVVRVQGSTAAVELAVAAEAARGPWSRDAVALDDRWAFAVTLGDFVAPRADKLWRIDLASGAVTEVASAAAPFGYSGLWADRGRRTIWLGERQRLDGDLGRWSIGSDGSWLMGSRVSSNPGSVGAVELWGR